MGWSVGNESQTNGLSYLELLLHVPSCHLYRCQLLAFSLGLALVMFDRLDLRHPIRNGGRELVLSTHSEIVLVQFDVAEVTHSDFSLLLAKIGNLFAEGVLLGHDRTQLRVGLLLLSGIVFELRQDRRLLGLLLLGKGLADALMSRHGDQLACKASWRAWMLSGKSSFSSFCRSLILFLSSRMRLEYCCSCIWKEVSIQDRQKSTCKN